MLKEKELLLKEIQSKIDPQEGFVLIRYQGMTPNMESDFRGSLVAAGGDYFVVKKRIFSKAAEHENIEYSANDLDGHIGLVYVTKPGQFVATAKALFDFKKDNADNVDVIGGYFEKSKYPSKDIQALSELPSLEEMRAQMLGLFEAPMSTTLATIEAILTSVMHCVQNKINNEN